jgi:hypothetical protein
VSLVVVYSARPSRNSFFARCVALSDAYTPILCIRLPKRLDRFLMLQFFVVYRAADISLLQAVEVHRVARGQGSHIT